MQSDSAEIDLESEFVRFAREADVGALARVFDATAPGLLSVARHLARGPSEAEDLVQQTFVTAIERSGTFDSSRSLLAWLTGILALHAKKQARNEARAPDPGRLPARDVEDPHRSAQGSEIRSAIDAAVGGLPEQYATVLRMHLLEQLVPREIARRIGIEPGTARVQLHRGLRMLRDALPAGFGGFAAVPLGAGAATSGLATVREAVLARGAAAVAVQPVIVATSVAWFAQPLAWIAAALVVLAGGYALFGRGDAALESADRTVALATPLDGGKQSATQALADPDVAVNASASSVSRAEVSPAPAASNPNVVRITGRLLLPSGAPASGAEVALDGEEATPQRMIDSAPPARWTDPAAIRTGPDGRFAFELVPRRDFSLSIEARLARYCALSWQWMRLAEDGPIDLGDRSFEPSCTVDVRVLGRDGNPIPLPFLVVGTPIGSASIDEREGEKNVRTEARFDEARDTYVLEGVPPGTCVVDARSSLTDAIEKGRVVARSGERAALDLVYDGPDLRARIVVMCSNLFHAVQPDLVRVRLHNGSEELQQSKAQVSWNASVVFDDLAPGEYTVEIDDPRFETFVKTGVAPGTRVLAKLRGNAGLRILVRASGEKIDADADLLSIVYSNTNRTPNEFDLFQPERLPVVDGFITGIVPGTCSLRVHVPGYAEKLVSIGELMPGERREVVVDVDRPRELRGIVLMDEGGTPSPGTAVLLTRGPRAGHRLGRSASVSDGRKGRIPAADRSTDTDERGRFAFEGLQKGTYTLRVAWSEWLYVDRTVEVGDEVGEELTIVEPAHGSLDVELRLPPDAVHEGIGVSVRSVDPTVFPVFLELPNGQVVTPPDSVTRVQPLAPGRYQMTLMLQSGDTWTSGVQPREVEVAANTSTPVLLDLTTSLPGRLRVRQTIEGVLRSDQQFELRRLDNQKLGPNLLSWPMDKEEATAMLAPGRYLLEYAAQDKTWFWRYPNEVEIEAGKELVIDVDIPIVQRTLKVVDAVGQPLAKRDLTVIAQDDPNAPKTVATTDELGHARVTLLPARYRVRVDGADSVPFEWNRDVTEPFEVRVAVR